MSPEIIALLMIVLLFALFVIGLEIGFAMAAVGFIGFGLLVNFQAALYMVAMDFYHVFTSYGFTVIPVFVLMGQLSASAGVSRDLYKAANRWVGHAPGGLAIATVMAAAAFKAMCGSSIATTATFATVAVPEMDKYGYDKRLSCGTAATVGTLGALIPPSTTLVIYGLLTETSIGKLFLAGIIPGFIVTLVFMLTLFFWCRSNPNLGPRGERSTWRQRFAAVPTVAGVLVIFLVVVGGLMLGFFSPTEAGSVGVLAVLILVVAKRDMDLKRFITAVMESVRLGCMVLTLTAGATVLGHFFSVTKMVFWVGEWLGSLPVPSSMVIMIILLVFLIGGQFIEDMAFFILSMPIFFPIAVKLGFDPVWFGIVITTTLMIGVIIPPMAIVVFVASGITKVPIGTIYKGIYPFFWGLVFCNLLFLFFPQVSLWLPNLFIK
jgi:tripartite ATP-independent transporter DctM subunit